MGQKRKAAKDTNIAKEAETSNLCPETKNTEEKFDLHTDKANPVEAVNVEDKVQENPNGLPQENKKSNVTTVALRRSGRIKNSSLSKKPVVRHFNLVEDEKEDHVNRVENKMEGHVNLVEKEKDGHVNLVENEKEEPQQTQQVSTSPVLSKENVQGEQPFQQFSNVQDVHGKRLEKKIDYLVQSVDEFKTKTFKQVATRPNEGPSPDLSYKSLYIDSQKKIEALMTENYELVKELEYARGKAAAYEKMKEDGPRELILLSSVGKATDATVCLSPQNVQNFIPSSPPAPAPATAGDSKQKKNNYKKKKAKS